MAREEEANAAKSPEISKEIDLDLTAKGQVESTQTPNANTNTTETTPAPPSHHALKQTHTPDKNKSFFDNEDIVFVGKLN